MVVCREKAQATDVQHIARQLYDKADQTWVDQRIEPKVNKEDVDRV